jgi:peptidoglycan lytic transglycosylase
MRPYLDLRARFALAALGALCLAISLAVLPGTAQSDTSTATGAHAAVAADIAPGKSRLDVLAGRRAAVEGRVNSGAAGRRALLQRRSGKGWTTIDRATTRAVYRRAAVSWYGPGLYGNKLSCGGRLTPGTLGVAHKTLPCGAHVTLRKGNRVLRVPVVDRGPYAGGREFDLTSATRERLHFRGVGSLLVAS